MSNCPQCEHHKETARMWRQEAYKLSGHPLNDEQGASMTDREAIKMALDAFKHICGMRFSIVTNAICEGNIERLEAALAQPEQEPVGWFAKSWPGVYVELMPEAEDAIPFYTAPPKREWVGLTDDELAESLDINLGEYDLCLEIEAKLKEKNT